MSLDTLHISLKKIEAVLRAATPDYLDERDKERMGWLIHVAEDYLQEVLEDLDAEIHGSPEEK